MKDSGRRPSIVEMLLLERQRQALAATRINPWVENTEKRDIEDVPAEENNQDPDIENVIVHEKSTEISNAIIDDIGMEETEIQSLEMADIAEATDVTKAIDTEEETESAEMIKPIEPNTESVSNLKRPLGILRML